ncbi:MAG TPA: hypothetical protein PLH63_04930 [Candidatus Cloacimonadota bacterium]|nr:hypothetical protein [Candidatus Cloacimonadota bacterium]
MKQAFIILQLIVLVLLLACSGEEVTGVDKTPPSKPLLYKHLGDTGDGWVYLDESQTDSLYINEYNNGIDAVPTGNKIRIHWEHILDKDLKIIRIFRFARGYHAIKIDSLAADYDEYEDQLVNIGDFPALETEWNYFIQAIDHAGNMSISDTVSYRLIEKASLLTPADNTSLMNSNITFKWNKGRDVEKYRLLIFDHMQQYLWHRDLDVSLEENIIELEYNSNNPLPKGTYYWRVDAFRDRIEGGDKFFSGSESLERKFIIE